MPEDFDFPISALPVDPNLSGSELVPIVDQAATPRNRRTTIQAIIALVTKTTLGLGSVDNTSDLNKPVSTATEAALGSKAAAGPIGDSGLTMTAGLLGRESGTGAPLVYSLGSGLAIVGGALTVTGGGGGYPSLGMPTGFNVVGNGTATLTVTYSTGYSLPTNTSQASWDAAAVLAGTAVQPAALASTLIGYVQTSDARLTDSREWSATTISQAEAEAGSATTRRAFTAQRIFQAAAAWWAASASATGQALATAANAAAARTTLGLGSAATAATGDFAAASHSQAASTISDSTATGRAVLTAADAAAARSAIGAGTSSLAVSSNAPAALGATAAAGTTGQAADAGHIHQRDIDVIVIPVGDETTALTTGTNKIRFRMPFPATLLEVRSGLNLAPTGSTFIVDINEGGTSVLGTKLSIDATETSSTTAASAATITDPNLADAAEISIDIDQIGSTTAGAGLKVYLYVRRS